MANIFLRQRLQREAKQKDQPLCEERWKSKGFNSDCHHRCSLHHPHKQQHICACGATRKIKR